MPRDTLHDSLRVKWPAVDSLMQALLTRPGYSITRYQGDTAYFDATHSTLDLLPGKNKRVVVERDSQTIVSDSGIYYAQATKRVTTGGNYILSSPGTGQADISGHGQGAYDLRDRSARVSNVRLPVNNGVMWFMVLCSTQLTSPRESSGAS